MNVDRPRSHRRGRRFKFCHEDMDTHACMYEFDDLFPARLSHLLLAVEIILILYFLKHFLVGAPTVDEQVPIYVVKPTFKI